MHPIGALVTGAVAGAMFVVLFTLTQNRWRIDDVLGVWPLHGVCGAWGGIACGIFGATGLGGVGGVAFGAQLVGTLLGVVDRAGRRRDRLRLAESDDGSAARSRRGVQRRGPRGPQDQLDRGPGDGLVARCPPTGSPSTGRPR